MGSNGIPLGFPVVVLCHGDPVVLDLSVHPLHILQQLIDCVDIGVGQLVALVLGLGSSWVGQLTSFPSSLLPR